MTIYIASTDSRFDGNYIELGDYYGFGRTQCNYIEQFENRSHLYWYAKVEEELGDLITPRSTIAEICHELAQIREAGDMRRVTRKEAIGLFRWSLPKMFSASNQPKYYAKNRIKFKLSGFPQYVWS